jgi:hypothetical protein
MYVFGAAMAYRVPQPVSAGITFCCAELFLQIEGLNASGSSTYQNWRSVSESASRLTSLDLAMPLIPPTLSCPFKQESYDPSVLILIELRMQHRDQVHLPPLDSSTKQMLQFILDGA